MTKIIQFPSNQKTPMQNPEFSDRLERIRYSLNRINQLMADLKQMSKEGMNNVESIKR